MTFADVLERPTVDWVETPAAWVERPLPTPRDTFAAAFTEMLASLAAGERRTDTVDLNAVNDDGEDRDLGATAERWDS